MLPIIIYGQSNSSDGQVIEPGIDADSDSTRVSSLTDSVRGFIADTNRYIDTTLTEQTKSGKLTVGDFNITSITENTSPDSLAVIDGNGDINQYSQAVTASKLTTEQLIDSIQQDANGFDSLIIGGSVYLARMELYGTIQDSSIVLPLTQNTYAPISNGDSTWAIIINDGYIVQQDSIQVPSTDVYEIIYDLSLSGASGDDYEGGIFINNTLIQGGGWSLDRASDDNSVITARYKNEISSSHWIKLMIVNTANNNDATISYGNLSIRRMER